jgi:hypothetical protein
MCFDVAEASSGPVPSALIIATEWQKYPSLLSQLPGVLRIMLAAPSWKALQHFMRVFSAMDDAKDEFQKARACLS